MEYTGINSGNVKSNNRSALLRLLNDCGAMSRKDIAAALGLTPATVTLICADLLTAGVLVEQGEVSEKKRAGRKKISIGIDYDSRFALCISLEVNDTFVTVCNMRGDVLSARTIKTDTDMPGEDFLHMVADISKAMLWEQGIRKETVLGVGVTVPGMVERVNDVTGKSSRLWQNPVDVIGELKSQLDYPVVLENNVKAFAEAELIYGTGKEMENLLLVKWGPGVGAALITNRQIYEGTGVHPAAELGHMNVVPGGKPCRCGRKGCLETLVSAHAIATQLQEICSEQTTPGLYALVGGNAAGITPRNISTWITAEDEPVRRIVEGDIGVMAQMVSNVATFWVPDRVITYGDMFDLPHFQQKFIECCGSYDPNYGADYIKPSALNTRLSYIGPLAVVVREQFFDRQNWDTAR